MYICIETQMAPHKLEHVLCSSYYLKIIFKIEISGLISSLISVKTEERNPLYWVAYNTFKLTLFRFWEFYYDKIIYKVTGTLSLPLYNMSSSPLSIECTLFTVSLW